MSTGQGLAEFVGRGILAQLTEDGLIPEDEGHVCVEYVTMTRISILRSDGTVDVMFEPYWAATVSPEAHAAMARKMLADAERRADTSGA